MLGINVKHSLATVAVTLGVLVAAGPANAARTVIEPIGTKYTMVDPAKNEVSVETIELATPRLLPEINDEVL